MGTQTFSRHARQRMGQRGFRQGDVELIHRCGTRIDDDAFFVTQKDVAREISRLKEEIRALERLPGSKVVIKGDHVATVYRTTKKHGKRVLRCAREGGNQ